MHKIFIVSYMNMAGEFKAVIVAKDKEESILLFSNYFGEDIDSENSNSVEVGTGNKYMRSRILLAWEPHN